MPGSLLSPATNNAILKQVRLVVLATALRTAPPVPGTKAKPTRVSAITRTAVGTPAAAVEPRELAALIHLSQSDRQIGVSPQCSPLRSALAVARPGITPESWLTVRPSSLRTRSRATMSASDCMSRRATRWTPRSTANAAKEDHHEREDADHDERPRRAHRNAAPGASTDPRLRLIRQLVREERCPTPGKVGTIGVVLVVVGQGDDDALDACARRWHAHIRFRDVAPADVLAPSRTQVARLPCR